MICDVCSLLIFFAMHRFIVANKTLNLKVKITCNYCWIYALKNKIISKIYLFTGNWKSLKKILVSNFWFRWNMNLFELFFFHSFSLTKLFKVLFWPFVTTQNERQIAVRELSQPFAAVRSGSPSFATVRG